MLNMLIDFMTKDKLTTRYFSEKYEKSPRAIMRYIEKMKDAKIPLASLRGRNGGFFLTNRIRLNKIFFTDNEIDDIAGAVSLCLPPKKASVITDKLELLKDEKSSKRGNGT
jgi:predicted DNA-binding transcriptional regulator YafY